MRFKKGQTAREVIRQLEKENSELCFLLVKEYIEDNHPCFVQKRDIFKVIEAKQRGKMVYIKGVSILGDQKEEVNKYFSINDYLHFLYSFYPQTTAKRYLSAITIASFIMFRDHNELYLYKGE